MTAVEVLDTLLQAGVKIIPGPDRPIVRLPASESARLKPLVLEHREELRRLIGQRASDLEAAYRKVWALPDSAPPETFGAAYRDLMALELQTPPDVAWWVLRATATTYHRDSGGRCPFCRVRGDLHLPSEQRELELQGGTL